MISDIVSNTCLFSECSVFMEVVLWKRHRFLSHSLKNLKTKSEVS